MNHDNTDHQEKLKLSGSKNKWHVSKHYYPGLCGLPSFFNVIARYRTKVMV